MVKKLNHVVLVFCFRRNNIFVTASLLNGNVIYSISVGNVQKRKAKKQFSAVLSWLIDRIGRFLAINFKGVIIKITASNSRAFRIVRYMKRHKITVQALRLYSPIVHNGCRLQKPRRL